MTSKRQSRFGDIAAAFMLLSRIPVKYQFAKDSPPDFISSLWAFPLVGLVIGGIGGMMLVVSSFFGLPLLVCGGLCVGVMAMASGAMHEDGLADTADGFGGGRDVDDKMRIMHDSHIGSYGVLALCLSTIIRISIFASIATLDLSNLALIGLVAAIAAAARWQILIALWAFPIAAGAKLAKVTGRPSVIAIFAAAFLWVMPMAYFAYAPCCGDCWQCGFIGLSWPWQACHAANPRHQRRCDGCHDYSWRNHACCRACSSP
jgi:adenosylcobinamide-GDP ribazoletransferase